MNIDPNNPYHQKLELEATEFLELNGYMIDNATYHEKMADELIRRLRFRNSPTALYIRGRADRLAVHTRYPIEFEWEAKTHLSKNLHDMTLEVLPLLFHMMHSDFGVKCLYIYRDPFHDPLIDVGFWVHNIPEIREIKIPARWIGEQAEWFESIFKSRLPHIRITRSNGNRGSGDPFCIINESVVTELPNWRDLISDTIIQHAQQEAQNSLDDIDF